MSGEAEEGGVRSALVIRDGLFAACCFDRSADITPGHLLLCSL